MREQGHAGAWCTLKQARQVVAQGQAGALYAQGHVLIAQLGLLYQFLQRRLHGVQQLGRGRHANHFQHAQGLVQLLKRQAQMAGVAFARFGIAHKAPYRPGGAVQRMAQFVQHPAQGLQRLQI